MFSLNCKIRIFETDEELKPVGEVFEFSHVKDIAITSSRKNFTDTAMVKMPKVVVINQLNNSLGIEIARRLPIDLKPRSIYEFFKEDYYIEIFLGYDGNYKPAFRGYIKAVKGDAPVSIECEDYMYFLKKHKIVADATPDVEEDLKNPLPNNPSERVDDPIEVIKSRLEELNAPFEVNILKEKVDALIINRNHNIVQFLNMLKEDYDIHSYFKLEEDTSVLHITNNPNVYEAADIEGFMDKYVIQTKKTPIPNAILKKALNVLGVNDLISFFKSDTFLGEARFRFNYNIIQDNLKIKNENVKKIRVRAEKYFANSNTPIFVEAGDPNGELVKKYTLHEDTRMLSLDNDAKFKKETQEIEAGLSSFASLRLAGLKQTGLTGSFVTFGEPFMRPTDRVFLENSEDEEKNGVFQVEEVQRSYGLGGYRQTISLGRLVSKEATK